MSNEQKRSWMGGAVASGGKINISRANKKIPSVNKL
jgi:hypothetical protein